MIDVLKNKKAIFFDVGYTLDFPTSGDWMYTRKFIEVAGSRLDGISREKLVDARVRAFRVLEENHLVIGIGEEYRQFCRFYAETARILEIDLNADEIAEIVRDRTTNMANYTAYPDAVCVVSTLSKTHKLGIISDTWPSITPQLKALGLHEYFSAYTYSCDLGVFKPDEKLFADALGQIGCRPEETVFVDDVIRNLEGAAKLGITPILIAANPGTDENTDFKIIHSLSELL